MKQLQSDRAGRGISGQVLRILGLLLAAVGAAGWSIVQPRLLGLQNTTLEQLMQAIRSDPTMQGYAVLNVVLLALEACAVPLFAFLLVEGFCHTESLRNYTVRVCAVALISEIPYNLAVSGRWIETAGVNPVVGMLLCLCLLYGYRTFRGKAVFRVVTRIMITVAAALWALILGIDHGVALVLLCATFWTLRERKIPKTVVACVVLLACGVLSVGYVAAPLALIPIWFYNGAYGAQGRVVRVVNYAAYPLILLAYGLLALLMP